jgi:signal transduction histidine kinase
MTASRGSGLDKILGRIEDLDSVNLGILVQRLARERQLQETVFNTIQDGILVIDSSGIVQYANEAARTLIALDEKNVGHAVLWKMVPDLARSIDPDGTPPARGRNKSRVLTREVELSYPEHRFVRLYMVPIDAPVGQSGTGGHVVVLSDVTEDKVSLEERIESERIASIVRLAAGVAHELGNPLNSLTIHLQLIERKLEKLGLDKEAAKLLESVGICQGEVHRLDGIITHFLEAVRPREPDLVEVAVLDVIEEVLRVQQAELEGREIQVNVEVGQTPPPILADRGQLKQVFFNLIKNAMEAMQKGGKLRILARSDDEFVYLQFVDTGSGIAEEDIPRIFQAYYTTKQTGHGLGMMIVQRIMRSHGGHIGVESRKGVGTAITLQFPQPHRRTRLLQADGG